MPHDLDAFQHADKAQIKPYLHDEIWRLVRGDDLPAGVDLVCAEIACLAGPGIAAQCLQRALGVAPDRHIGPLTLLSARKADPATLIPQISRQFLEFAATTRDSSLFDRGWTRRMEDDARIALGWARQASIDQSTAPADQVTSPDTADQRNDASPRPAEQFGQSLAALKKDGSG
jgi:lysozyme family protein